MATLQFEKTALPVQAGRIVDITPIEGTGSSTWLMLAEDGRLIRWNAGTLEWTDVAVCSLTSEAYPGRRWYEPKRRLHASPRSDFAAIVNDYGQYGQIIDLRSGKVTLALDGGMYHPETVPFSFTFAEIGERMVAIHRTDWNRLDVSDPVSGELLTDRDPTCYQRGEERPAHHLDYFHGALSLSPGGTQILDDGWAWHPVGIPAVWNLERWISTNVWESEDGLTRQTFGHREDWDHAVTWIDERRIAVGVLDEEDWGMANGTGIFEVLALDRASPDPDAHGASKTFPGPTGTFFSDGTWLFSSDKGGLSRWDPDSGERRDHLPDFQPTRHHRSARELAQLADGTLVRMDLSK